MRSIIVATLAGIIFAMAADMQTGAADSEDARLASFFKNYLDELFRLRPCTATRLGDHRFEDRDRVCE